MLCGRLFSNLVFLALLGCSGNDDKDINFEFPDPGESVLIQIPEQWEMEEDLMRDFPEGIEVYRNDTPFQGKDLLAYAVVFDPHVKDVEFRPALGSSAKTPSQWYDGAEGEVYAVINGGFFGPGVSYSLVQYQNEILSDNILSLTRSYNNQNTVYYPTRAAFGLTADGSPDVGWIYTVENNLYKYPAPSPNELNKEPQPKPSENFPRGGEKWQVESAIGGSPLLLRNGEINITDTEELIAVNNESSRARSAIGYTGDGKIILLAVEGNNSTGGVGLSLPELAQLLKEMGATDAINLDGGGSTSLIVNGETTIEPSSASEERAVMSVIFLEEK